jgi:O-antigen/teichoic acid export membrane protein
MQNLAVKNYRARALHFCFGVIYNLAFDIITSRALGPSSIGLFQIAKSFIEVFERIKSLNFSIIATKQEGNLKLIFNTYFTLLIFQELLFVFSFCVYTFLFEEKVNYVTTLLLCSSLFGSFNTLYRCRASRDLLFYKALKWLTLFKYIIGTLVCVFITYSPSPFFLALGELSFALLQLILFPILFKNSFSVIWEPKKIKAFLKSGLFYFILDLAPFLTIPLVYIYVGHSFSNHHVGIAAKALYLVGAPTFFFVYAFNSLLFNIVVKAERDGENVDSYIKSFFQLIVLSSIVMGSIIYINSEDLIEILWGEEWEQTNSAVAWLFATCIFAPISAVMIELLNAFHIKKRIVFIARLSQPFLLWATIYFTDDFNGILLGISLGYVGVTLSGLMILWKRTKSLVDIAVQALCIGLVCFYANNYIIVITGKLLACLLIIIIFITSLWFQGYRIGQLVAVMNSKNDSEMP